MTVIAQNIAHGTFAIHAERIVCVRRVTEWAVLPPPLTSVNVSTSITFATSGRTAAAAHEYFFTGSRIAVSRPEETAKGRRTLFSRHGGLPKGGNTLAEPLSFDRRRQNVFSCLYHLIEGRKIDFSCLYHLIEGRKTVFSCFYHLIEGRKIDFSRLYHLIEGRKTGFSRFYHLIEGRNTILAVIYSIEPLTRIFSNPVTTAHNAHAVASKTIKL